MFVEGDYNRRLEVIANSGLPAGKTMWIFDQTDMAETKKKFGSWACVGGNVPSSLFKVGTAEPMEVYGKKLIEACAPGGSFFLSPGAVLDQAKAENIHTYLRIAGSAVPIKLLTRRQASSCRLFRNSLVLFITK